MERTSNGFEKLSGSLEDRFDFLEPLAGTLSAAAFRAIDVTTREEVTVWRTRGPLRSAEISRFQERLVALQKVARVETILWCGVDSYERGFAVLRAYDGRKIDSSAASKGEIEERFDGCAAIVKALHDRSISCGDICLDSFILKDRGGVSLFAVLGDVALQHADDHEDCEANTYLAFRPPEQRQGGLQPTFVDVYALARLGEGLCAVRIKDEESGPVEAPPWIKELLDPSSSEDCRREHAAVEMVRLGLDAQKGDEINGEDSKEIEDLERGAHEHVESPPVGDEQDAAKESDESDGPALKKEGGQEGFDTHVRPGLTLGSLLSPKQIYDALLGVPSLIAGSSRVLILAVLNIAALGVLFYSYVEGRAGVTQMQAQRSLQTVQEEARAVVAALYESQSPTAYEDLVTLLNQETDPLKRQQLLEVVAFRARRQGFGRTSDIVLEEIREASDVSSLGSDDRVQPIVRVLNTGLSTSARLEEVARLYQSSPRLATGLAAASALDTGDAETYRGILARAVADQTGIPNGGEHNPYALMLILPDVYDLFSEDVGSLQDKIPGSDLVWLIEELGKQGRPEVSTVARMAEQRGLEKGARGVFLKELGRSVALQQRIRAAIVSGALGKLSMDDVRRFNEWYGQGAPRVLEAAILTAPPGALRRAAFDALVTKPVDDLYIAKVMDFIRSAYGEQGDRFAGVVAGLALRDQVGMDVLRQEFEVLRTAPRSQEFLRQLIQGAPVEVIPFVLERYSDSMDPLDIVDLLSNPSPQVRIVAVSSLTKVNDIMLLKLISQSYDEETDPKVRAAYEEKISLVRERVS
jgi:hypothetical protein